MKKLCLNFLPVENTIDTYMVLYFSVLLDIPEHLRSWRCFYGYFLLSRQILITVNVQVKFNECLCFPLRF